MRLLLSELVKAIHYIYSSVQFQIKVQKISRRRLRSPKYVELGHFTLLLCRVRQRNVQKFKAHAHRHCCTLLSLLFGGVLVAVIVMVRSPVVFQLPDSKIV